MCEVECNCSTNWRTCLLFTYCSVGKLTHARCFCTSHSCSFLLICLNRDDLRFFHFFNFQHCNASEHNNKTARISIVLKLWHLNKVKETRYLCLPFVSASSTQNGTLLRQLPLLVFVAAEIHSEVRPPSENVLNSNFVLNQYKVFFRQTSRPDTTAAVELCSSHLARCCKLSFESSGMRWLLKSTVCLWQTSFGRGVMSQADVSNFVPQ